MCGLLGFSGNPKELENEMVAKMVLNKLKILGLYNESRGRHSCGIYIGNTIYKGVDKDKEFSSFIQNNEIELPTSKYPVVIGHTRHATVGEHTAKNAHPFVVNKGELIMAHNGVIRNIWTLCNKHKVDHDGIKVDSEALAHLINTHGFKMLEEYDGHAALLMYKNSEPNSMYVYRGMSKKTFNGELEEERPMFYMATKEGTYFSSMASALYAISDSSSDKVKQLEGNIVHKFTNGYMTKVKFPIIRAYFSYTAPVQTPQTPQQRSSAVSHFPSGSGAMNQNRITSEGTNSRIGSSAELKSLYDSEEVQVPEIWYETTPARATKKVYDKDTVFFHRGRYWKVEIADGTIVMLHGRYYINKRGMISEFKVKGTSNCYFYEGVLLRNLESYNKAIADVSLKDSRYNFALLVSTYSQYPVFNTQSDCYSRCKEAAVTSKRRWFKDGKMVQIDAFTPAWSDRNYAIKDGKTESIKGGSTDFIESMIDYKELSTARRTAMAKLHSEKTYGSKTTSVIPPKTEDKKEEPAKPLTPPINIYSKEGVVQSTFQFKKDSANDPSEFNPIHFYMDFTSVEEARSTFTLQEINALRFYICDIMALEMLTVPDFIDDDSVDIQLNMALQHAIDTNQSMMDTWDKEYNDVYHYLLLAKENKDNRYKEEESVEDKADKCCALDQKTFHIPTISEMMQQSANRVESKAQIPNMDIIRTLEDVKKLKESDDLPFDIVEPVENQANSAHIPVNTVEELDADEIPDDDDVPVEDVTEDQETEYMVGDMIDEAASVREAADDFHDKDTPYCDELANLIYKTYDPFFKNLDEIMEKHKKKVDQSYLKDRLKSLNPTV